MKIKLNQLNLVADILQAIERQSRGSGIAAGMVTPKQFNAVIHASGQIYTAFALELPPPAEEEPEARGPLHAGGAK
tara:strand:+ start:87 stop:314 length:228 start_codon:yes stop_codon:yes gene_type:complete